MPVPRERYVLKELADLGDDVVDHLLTFIAAPDYDPALADIGFFRSTHLFHLVYCLVPAGPVEPQLFGHV